MRVRGDRNPACGDDDADVRGGASRGVSPIATHTSLSPVEAMNGGLPSLRGMGGVWPAGLSRVESGSAKCGMCGKRGAQRLGSDEHLYECDNELEHCPGTASGHVSRSWRV